MDHWATNLDREIQNTTNMAQEEYLIESFGNDLLDDIPDFVLEENFDTIMEYLADSEDDHHGFHRPQTNSENSSSSENSDQSSIDEIINSPMQTDNPQPFSTEITESDVYQHGIGQDIFVSNINMFAPDVEVEAEDFGEGSSDEIFYCGREVEIGDINAGFSGCTAKFDGLQDMKELEDFLFQINWYKVRFDIPDEKAIEDLQLVLQGQARNWWNNIQIKPVSWSEATGLIRKTFGLSPAIQERLAVYMKQETRIPKIDHYKFF